MIAYDDLVAALAAWRTRQGLPVAHQSTAAALPPSPPPSRGRAAPAAPAPAARPGTARGVAAPAPASDFDDAALVEDASYDTGEDYVMQLGETVEPTAIGSAPEPPPTRGKRPGW